MKKLPLNLQIKLQDLINKYPELDDILSQAILDYLSDTYGYCVNSYSTDETLNIYDIDWDTTEN